MKYTYMFDRLVKGDKKKDVQQLTHVGTVWFDDIKVAEQELDYMWGAYKFMPNVLRLALIDENKNVLKEYKCQ